ncbi:hypothetical protein KBZ20_09985 [Vulcanococcus limneticus Candia 3F8]|uniref:hypothetical protein n=1 Tax=Vulcanococcus limneticus TaxID=2170428 RepID=UPI000B9989F2|nr:hypothetical protein [Vulcanococcus limneticus]MCP9792420.1 hypothetical protein [Vulcanococcus limneticus MW73D5]MCP9894100.1 hypothetical protein [Vulcanococcus limneticus Candia 3F8]
MVAALLRALMALVLVGLILVDSGCSRVGQAPTPAAQAPIAGTAPTGRLQEVSPPPLVRQLAERLEERDPQLEILAPADGALLPAGPWSLRLRLRDWPLADAGPLGLGPHLVVQVDGQTVRRLSHPDELRELSLPELAPGSHRVTVYAARPWGEAVKSPGASRQVRLHRVAANPQQLPAPGSAQLVLASPDGLAEAEPVLIDWLLFDAPLQNLREGDGRWRLRVTVNGDSFLVDRHAPLWLRGLTSGSNALQLELLDGRGEPLNSPFNSLVREVQIQPGPRPGWLRGSLTPLELDQLSGLAPVDAGEGGIEDDQQGLGEEIERSGRQTGKSQDGIAGSGAARPGSITPAAPQTPQSGAGLLQQAAPEIGAERGSESEGAGASAPTAPGPANTPPATSAPPTAFESRPEPTGSAAERPDGQTASPEVSPPAAPEADEADAMATAAPPMAASNDWAPDAENQTTQAPAAEASPAREALTSSEAVAGEPSATDSAPEPRQASNDAAAPQPPATPAAPPQTPPPPAQSAAPSPVEERIAPSTGLAGSARQLVNADGSLVKPKGSGPLARLRERLQR